MPQALATGLHGQVTRYTRTAMALHWVVAILIIANVVIVWTVDLLPDSFGRPMVDLHKSIGFTVLGLAIMRVLWRQANPPPPLPADYPAIEKFGAHAAHILLYVLIFGLPITGWLHDSAWNGAATHPVSLYWLVPWFRIGLIEHQDPVRKEFLHSYFYGWHVAFSYILYGLVALHIAGALKHQWVDRHPELQRMLPGGRIRR